MFVNVPKSIPPWDTSVVPLVRFDEVLDEIRCAPPHIAHLGVRPLPTAASADTVNSLVSGDDSPGAIERRWRSESCRTRSRSSPDRNRRKAAALPRRSDVPADRSVGIADVAVHADLRLVVTTGIVAVGGVQDQPAVALRVVRRGEARHDGVGVDADDAAGRLAPHPLEAEPEVGGQMAGSSPSGPAHRPSGCRRSARTSNRQPVLQQRLAGHEHRNQTAAPVEHRRCRWHR